MSYLAVPLVIFVFWAVPAAPSDPLPALFVIMVLAACSAAAGLQGLSLALVECAALLIAVLRFMPDASPSYGIEAHAVRAVIAEAQQDSVQRRYRSVGFRATLVAAEDGEGMLSSASGSVYVISSQADAASGDRLYLPGRVSGPVFYADGAVLISRSPLSSIRVMMRSAIRERLSVHGEAGELGMRLLLGYGEMGVFSLSSDASASGLMHVLALSGMHLSILSAMLSSLLFMVNARRRSFAICIFLIFFSFLSGWRPSLVRALIFRFSIAYAKDRDLAFLLSFLFLQIIFPYSCTDLGSVYSFISLAGIFMLSEPIDRAFRLFLPLPKSFSLSAAASVSALLLSVPLTMDVFGCYQLGTVLSSFPASMMISLYMGLSIIAAVFPFSGCFLRIAYEAVELIFRVSALFPRSEDLTGYAVLLLLSVLLIAIDIAYRIFSGKYVEPELQQHK